jgi:hypothetical protein
MAKSVKRSDIMTTEEDIDSQDSQNEIEETDDSIEEVQHMDEGGEVQNGEILEHGIEEEDPEVVEIEPISISVNRWQGLSKNSTTMHQHIFELVDNSIAHHVVDVPLRIDIIIERTPSQGGVRYANKVTIKDNASGISINLLSRALMPDALAGHWGQDVGSEHGYGMKPALASLSDSPEIMTKPKDEAGYIVQSDQIINLVNGEASHVVLSEIEELGEHGTIIVLKDLTIGKGQTLGMAKSGVNPLEDLLGRLGQRYREVLKSSNNIFGSSEDSGIFVKVIESNGNEADHKIIMHSPIYFQCPFTATYGVPVEDKTFPLSSTNPQWSAKIRVGKAPHKPRHYDHITQDKPGKSHPYYVSKKNAGFDIVHRDIVIKTGWIPPKEMMPGIDDHGSTNNYIRGEIILESGFQSTKIKDFPDANEAWFQLTQKLEELLFKYSYRDEVINLYEKKLKWKSEQKQTYTETQYVNQLKNKLDGLEKSNARIINNYPRVRSFTRNYEKPTTHGKPDITINPDSKDEIMVEAKQDAAEGRHVYQLVAYMDANDCRYGIILSPGIADTGMAAIAYLRKEKKKFKSRYNIEHLDTAEISNYSVDFE